MNKYDEILSQYIDSNSIYSYAQEPFLQTDHIITTNGMYLIRVPAELCEGVYQLRKYPDINGVIEQPDIKFQIDREQLKTIHDNLKKLSEETFKMDTTACIDCKSSGTVEYKFVDSKYETHKITNTCPICDGLGETEIVINLKTKQPVDKYKLLVTFEDVNIELEYLSMLLKISDSLGANIFINHINKSRGIQFEIGEVLILVIKMSSTENDLVIQY